MADTETVLPLALNDLAAGTPGLTPECAASLAQAASVCLEEEGHAPGAVIDIDGSFQRRFNLQWDEATTQMRRCWADSDEATEFGACGVATLLIHALTDLTIVQRARRGNGFDYWLGRRDDDPDLLFQGRTRLEVSGVRKGGDSIVNAREREKLRQVERFANPSVAGTPAIVIVVEFGTPRSRVTTK